MNADELTARLTILSLEGVGPNRARWLLGDRSGVEALEGLRAGRMPVDGGPAPVGVTKKVVQQWIVAARAADERALAEETVQLGIEVVEPGHPHWPFATDPDPPILLFCLGRMDLLTQRPAVAIVGTRRCTTIGREVASTLGRELAEAGVVVVSGLASGIDGRAHQGTLAGGGLALAVVGTGLDVVYPRSNRGLWHRIGSEGLLVSEAVPGAKPERWRFPARNRLIAGLAGAVVVVESHDRGGSLHTVDEAAERGITVMAVPGSVTSPASAGTNQLLLDGCPPVCSAADVLAELGVDAPASPMADANADAEGAGPLAPLAEQILTEAAAGAVHIDRLVEACATPIPAVLAEVRQLEVAGHVRLDGSTVVRADHPAQPTSFCHKE